MAHASTSVLTRQAATTGRSAGKAAAQPARKPVYLNGIDRIRVRASAEALAVVRPGRDVARLPITRISRIIASRLVDWDAEALILCLEHGIPIIFLDNTGQASGICQPRHLRADSLSTLIESAMEQATWPQRHENWLLHRRSIILADWRKRQEYIGGSAWLGDFHGYQRDYVHRNEIPESTKPEVFGWLLGLVVETLHGHGINTRYCGCQPYPFDLAIDLTALLRAELFFHGERMLEAAEDDLQAQLRMFEAWTRQHGAIIERHLFDLRKNLTQYVTGTQSKWR